MWSRQAHIPFTFHPDVLVWSSTNIKGLEWYNKLPYTHFPAPAVIHTWPSFWSQPHQWDGVWVCIFLFHAGVWSQGLAYVWQVSALRCTPYPTTAFVSPQHACASKQSLVLISFAPFRTSYIIQFYNTEQKLTGRKLLLALKRRTNTKCSPCAGLCTNPFPVENSFSLTLVARTLPTLQMQKLRLREVT